MRLMLLQSLLNDIYKDFSNELEFVNNLYSKPFWIGLTDKDEESNFQWVTGEPLMISNWGKYQPDNKFIENYT